MQTRRLLRRFSQTLTPVRFLCASGAAAATASANVGGVAVKRVTSSNFAAAAEELRVRVREADFVAVDLEMTGVTSAPWRDAFELDRSDVRYLKVKDSAEKFAAVQVGVCPFRWDASKNAFIAHPHNFFVFPHKELHVDSVPYEFLCQTTSIEFLAKYQFDFNTCIREGISYLSRAQEEGALQKLTSTYKDRISASMSTSEEYGDLSLHSTADVLFTERMKNKFKEWRDEIFSNPIVGHHLVEHKCNTNQFQTDFFKMRPAILLNGFSSHQLKLIQLILKKNFKDLIYVRTVGEDGTWQKRVVYTDTNDDQATVMKEVQEDLLRSKKERVNSAVGFRHVIDLLASERKLIVGHNCFLDIAHIYSKFIGPLPSSMEEFVFAVHKNFPYIIDTKHLLNNNQAAQYLMKKRSKSLSSVFSLLCQAVSSASKTSTATTHVRIVVEADEAISSCFNSGAKHEAGYDAFMTGCVFAQLCTYLGVKFDLLTPELSLATNDKLQKYINLLYPSWNSGTVVDLSTGTERPESGYKRKYPAPVFDNIVLVWGFPSKLKQKDLKDCICKVFGPASVISIFYLDSTAALIQFAREELVNNFLDLKDMLERKNDDPLSVLHPLSVVLEGGKTKVARYDTYKDICSSSLSKVLFAGQAEAVGITPRRQLKIENVKAEDVPGSDESTLDGNLLAPVEELEGRKSNSKKQGNHEVSCEDILDSLYAGKPLFGKHMRSA